MIGKDNDNIKKIISNGNYKVDNEEWYYFVTKDNKKGLIAVIDKKEKIDDLRALLTTDDVKKCNFIHLMWDVDYDFERFKSEIPKDISDMLSNIKILNKEFMVKPLLDEEKVKEAYLDMIITDAHIIHAQKLWYRYDIKKSDGSVDKGNVLIDIRTGFVEFPEYPLKIVELLESQYTSDNKPVIDLNAAAMRVKKAIKEHNDGGVTIPSDVNAVNDVLDIIVEYMGILHMPIWNIIGEKSEIMVDALSGTLLSKKKFE
ncbi:MAG: hypothetical protein M1481_03850 [Candidatus Thermoplasmatota archaeon]|jgi:hypothetical protein|nr:hypothetical protein [Candidatus Thermoplasmatota archaeon]MCL5963353.1 hypothetical protein [Candidatus Thermoplasmatota archaeon]